MEGLYTALVTPFSPDLEVDYAVFRSLIKEQIAAGVHGVVILGTTGESPTILPEERQKLIQIAVEEAKKRIPIIVGTGSYSTKQTVLNNKQAQMLGADMALVVTPYYNKPTSEGLYRHFKEVAEQCDLPMILYNIQGRCAKNIDTPTLKRLALFPNIIGVKEASGSIEQMTEVIHTILEERPDFKIFSGDDALTLPLMALGGHGIISVVSNLAIKQMLALVKAALQGDFATARKHHYALFPLFRGAFLETNPIPIKEAMNLYGKKVGGYRLPLCEMTEENKAKLKKLLEGKQFQ